MSDAHVVIVHHHGMGKARAPWVKQEYGSSFYILETLKHAFDPEGMDQARTVLPESVEYCRDAPDAAAGADALVVITEW